MNLREDALRLVLAKNLIEVLLKPGTFWSLLVACDRSQTVKIVEITARVVEQWKPPTLEGFSEELLRGWLNDLHTATLINLYGHFCGVTSQEETAAAVMWG